MKCSSDGSGDGGLNGLAAVEYIMRDYEKTIDISVAEMSLVGKRIVLKH